MILLDAYPINVLNAIKNCPEVCSIFCATANPVEVIIAESSQGRGVLVLGVIDGFFPKGVEGRVLPFYSNHCEKINPDWVKIIWKTTHKSNFRYDEVRDTYICPEGKDLKRWAEQRREGKPPLEKMLERYPGNWPR